MSACVPLWTFAVTLVMLIAVGVGLMVELHQHGKTEAELDALRTRLNMTGKTE
jgi:hypothetical protein